MEEAVSYFLSTKGHYEGAPVPLGSKLHRYFPALAYRLAIIKARLPCPPSLSSFNRNGFSLGVKYSATMFETTCVSFWGRTYQSRVHPVELRSDGFLHFLSDSDSLEQIFVISSISDVNCLLVIEPIIVLLNSNGHEVYSQSNGFFVLTPFIPGRVLTDVNQVPFDQVESLRSPLNSGSAFLLLTSLENVYDHIPDCYMQYKLQFFRELGAISHLVRDSELFGVADVIPGLTTAPAHAESLRVRIRSRTHAHAFQAASIMTSMGGFKPLTAVPRLAPHLRLRVSQLRLATPRGLLSKVEFAVSRRREVELGLPPGSIPVGAVRVSRVTVHVEVQSAHACVASGALPLGQVDTSTQELADFFPRAKRTPETADFFVPVAGERPTLQQAEQAAIVLEGYSPHPLMALRVALSVTVREPLARALGLEDAPDVRAQLAAARESLALPNFSVDPLASVRENDLRWIRAGAVARRDLALSQNALQTQKEANNDNAVLGSRLEGEDEEKKKTREAIIERELLLGHCYYVPCSLAGQSPASSALTVCFANRGFEGDLDLGIIPKNLDRKRDFGLNDSVLRRPLELVLSPPVDESEAVGSFETISDLSRLIKESKKQESPNLKKKKSSSDVENDSSESEAEDAGRSGENRRKDEEEDFFNQIIIGMRIDAKQMNTRCYTEDRTTIPEPLHPPPEDTPYDDHLVVEVPPESESETESEEEEEEEEEEEVSIIEPVPEPLPPPIPQPEPVREATPPPPPPMPVIIPIPEPVLPPQPVIVEVPVYVPVPAPAPAPAPERIPPPVPVPDFMGLNLLSAPVHPFLESANALVHPFLNQPNFHKNALALHWNAPDLELSGKTNEDGTLQRNIRYRFNNGIINGYRVPLHLLSILNKCGRTVSTRDAPQGPQKELFEPQILPRHRDIIEIELSDKLTAQRISISFLAYLPNVRNDQLGHGAGMLNLSMDELYFGVKLFSCPYIRTGVVKLVSFPTQGSSAFVDLDLASAPFFLLHSASPGPSPPLLTAKTTSCFSTLVFEIDPTSIHPQERLEFLEQMALGSIVIEVWNARTLLPVGSASISLLPLLRQQRQSKQMVRAFDVISPQDITFQFHQSRDIAQGRGARDVHTNAPVLNLPQVDYISASAVSRFSSPFNPNSGDTIKVSSSLGGYTVGRLVVGLENCGKPGSELYLLSHSQEAGSSSPVHQKVQRLLRNTPFFRGPTMRSIIAAVGEGVLTTVGPSSHKSVNFGRGGSILEEDLVRTSLTVKGGGRFVSSASPVNSLADTVAVISRHPSSSLLSANNTIGNDKSTKQSADILRLQASLLEEARAAEARLLGPEAAARLAAPLDYANAMLQRHLSLETADNIRAVKLGLTSTEKVVDVPTSNHAFMNVRSVLGRGCLVEWTVQAPTSAHAGACIFDIRVDNDNHHEFILLRPEQHREAIRLRMRPVQRDPGRAENEPPLILDAAFGGSSSISLLPGERVTLAFLLTPLCTNSACKEDVLHPRHFSNDSVNGYHERDVNQVQSSEDFHALINKQFASPSSGTTTPTRFCLQNALAYEVTDPKQLEAGKISWATEAAKSMFNSSKDSSHSKSSNLPFLEDCGSRIAPCAFRRIPVSITARPPFRDPGEDGSSSLDTGLSTGDVMQNTLSKTMFQREFHKDSPSISVNINENILQSSNFSGNNTLSKFEELGSKGLANRMLASTRFRHSSIPSTHPHDQMHVSTRHFESLDAWKSRNNTNTDAKNELVAELIIQLCPSSPTISRVIRYIAPEHSQLEASLPIPPLLRDPLNLFSSTSSTNKSDDEFFVPHVAIPDAHVPLACALVQSHPLHVHETLEFKLETSSSPNTVTFHVLLYDNHSFGQLIETWQVIVHSVYGFAAPVQAGSRIDFQLNIGSLTQSPSQPLPLGYLYPGSSCPQSLQLMKDSLFKRVTETVSGSIIPLLPSTGAGHTLTLGLADPIEIGQMSSILSGEKNSKDRLLRAAWKLQCICQPGKTLHVQEQRLLCGEVNSFTIKVSNNWGMRRRFTVVCSHPALLRPIDPVLDALPGRDLQFALRTTIVPKESAEWVAVYIQNENLMLEATILVHLIFGNPVA